MEEVIILTFASTHRALGAEKIFAVRRIPFVTIPVPRRISAGCGLALQFAAAEEAAVQRVIKDENIIFEGIHYLKK
ncbi:MAG: DUF3343 domain-containing protein [bacterium]